LAITSYGACFYKMATCAALGLGSGVAKRTNTDCLQQSAGVTQCELLGQLMPRRTGLDQRHYPLARVQRMWPQVFPLRAAIVNDAMKRFAAPIKGEEHV
jgi:hypothetical protein